MRTGLDPWLHSGGQGSSTAISCGCRHGLDPMLLWLWCRPAAIAQIWPLTWEPPYATREALKSKKQTNKQKTNSNSFQPKRKWFSTKNLHPFFFLLRATPVAYGSSQTRSGVGAAAASLHHSSWPHQILNPLSEARDRTCNLTDASHVH